MIGRTLIVEVRRSAELQGSMYGRTVPNRTVQSSAISSAKFDNKSLVVRPYKVRQLVRQSLAINLTLFGRKGGKLTSGSVTMNITININLCICYHDYFTTY